MKNFSTLSLDELLTASQQANTIEEVREIDKCIQIIALKDMTKEQLIEGFLLAQEIAITQDKKYVDLEIKYVATQAQLEAYEALLKSTGK